jgi:hypothetical protein
MPAIRIDKAAFPENSTKTMKRLSHKAMRTLDLSPGTGSGMEDAIHFPFETSERKKFRTKNGKVCNPLLK